MAQAVSMEKRFIEYTIGDSRKVKIYFTGSENETKVVETFEAEDINAPEMQKTG
ncbi:MAG: hypothetical protein ABI691_05945 [Ginsengibacter sp.]